MVFPAGDFGILGTPKERVFAEEQIILGKFAEKRTLRSKTSVIKSGITMKNLAVKKFGLAKEILEQV